MNKVFIALLTGMLCLAGQAQAQGVAECVVLDQAEQVTSVVAGNLFVVRDGELLTPRLLHC